MYKSNSNRELLLDSDQESVYSFDSSQVCSLGQRTASINSQISIQKQLDERILISFSKEQLLNDESLSKTISIEKPRLQIKNFNQFNQHCPQIQIGFVMGKNKKNINFDQSKLKKVKNFFDEDQQISLNTAFLNRNDQLFTNNTLMNFPILNISDLKIEDNIQFSMPFFKNMGKKNNTIDVDKNLLQKAKNFFDDDSQTFKQQLKFFQAQPQFKSFKKPTKLKKNSTQLLTLQKKETDFAKTVNVNKNKKNKQIKKVKKQIFDWDKYEINSHKRFLQINDTSQRKSNKKQSNKKSARNKSKSKSKNKSNISNKSNKKQKVFFQSIRLKDLNVKQFDDVQKFKNFQQKKQQILTLTFSHQTENCQVPKCILCSLSINIDEINLQALEKLFTNKLIIEKIQTQIFTNLYQQVVYKLLKYSTFFPNIVNKNLNPSNVLFQIHKKAKLLQSGQNHLGWLDHCIKQSKFYYSFILEVRFIYHNQKINTFFILLSDGWTNVWAIVTGKNLLYNFLHKLKICNKIFIGYWKHYSLSNVLNFCPKSKQGQKCIEFFYNSSILVNQNVKIGKTMDMIFYRSMNLNRKEGGMIPTVQGIVLRMFCISSSKKKSTNLQNQNIFKQNFLEILSPQGYTVLIKFILPSDRSLAQLFRLYFKYHFYYLKIGKDNILQFNDEYSKFFEFQKKEKNIYQPQLIIILKGRYINAISKKKIQDKLRIGNSYDIRMQGNSCKIGDLIFTIQRQINQFQTTITNSFLKNPSYLYQQYRLDRIQKEVKTIPQKSTLTQYILKKNKYSNILKSLPSVYDKLTNQFQQ